MRLVHYTDTPLQKIEYREQDKSHFKPSGFWVSDEDEFGWKEWCLGEEFHPERLVLSYEITLAEDHGVLFLTSAQDIKNFAEDYPDGTRYWCIDWHAVRTEWDGLIITPYQSKMRYAADYLWYNVWDCASGCIWNPVAIKSFDPCQISS